MTDATREREIHEAKREAARKVMEYIANCKVTWTLAEVLRGGNVSVVVDRLFPPLPQEEPDTIVRLGCAQKHRVHNGVVEYWSGGEQRWIEDPVVPSEYLRLAAALQRHRDRAWVAQHPEGVPDALGWRWRINREGWVECRAPYSEWQRPGDATLQWSLERIRLIHRLWNGSR